MCDPVSIIAGAVSIGSALFGASASADQSAAAAAMNKAQLEELALKKQQMELDAMQRQRQLTRNLRIAQSNTLTMGQAETGNTQGSSIQAGLATSSSLYGVNSGLTSAALQIGEKYNTSEMNYANASMQYQQAGANKALASDIFSVAKPIGQLGGFAYGKLFGV